MKIGTIAGWCIGMGAVSAVLGLQFASYQRQAEAAHKADQALDLVAQLASRPAPSPLAAFGRQGPSADEIRSIVREEVKTVAGTGASAAAPDPQQPNDPSRAGEAPSEPPGPSQVSLVALTEATRVVDDAITSGRWGDGDVDALRKVRGEMTGDQMEWVARRLSQGINSQQVKIAVAGPMF